MANAHEGKAEFIKCDDCGFIDENGSNCDDGAAWWWCRTCAKVLCAKCNLLSGHTEHRSVQWSPAQCIASLVLALEDRCRLRVTSSIQSRNHMHATLEKVKKILDAFIDRQLEKGNEIDRSAIVNLKQIDDNHSLDHVYNVLMSPILRESDVNFEFDGDEKRFKSLVQACARLNICSAPEKSSSKVLNGLATNDTSTKIGCLPEDMTPQDVVRCIMNWSKRSCTAFASVGNMPGEPNEYHGTPVRSEGSLDDARTNGVDMTSAEQTELKVRLARLYERPLTVRSRSPAAQLVDVSKPALRSSAESPPCATYSASTILVDRKIPSVQRSQSSRIVTNIPQNDLNDSTTDVDKNIATGNGNDQIDGHNGNVWLENSNLGDWVDGSDSASGSGPNRWQEFMLRKPDSNFELNGEIAQVLDQQNNNMTDDSKMSPDSSTLQNVGGQPSSGNHSFNTSEVFYGGTGPNYDRLSSSSRMSTRTDAMTPGAKCLVSAYEFGSDFLHRPVDVCALPRGALAVSDANFGVEIIAGATGERLLHLDTGGKSASSLAYAIVPKLLFVSLLDRKTRTIDIFDVGGQFAKRESIPAPNDPKIAAERARWIATTEKGELFCVAGDDRRSAVWRYGRLKQKWHLLKTERNVRYQYLKVVEENHANQTIVLLTIECNNGKVLLLVTPTDAASSSVCQEYDLSSAYGLPELGLRSPTAAVVDSQGDLLAVDWRSGRVLAVRRRADSKAASGRSSQTLAQLGGRNCLGMCVMGDWLFVACMLRRSVYAIRCVDVVQPSETDL